MSVNFKKPPAQSSGSSLGLSEPEHFSKGVGTSLSAHTPSVFQDMADRETPQRLREVFKWCKYLSKWSAVHKSHVESYATIPVTEVLVTNLDKESEVIREIKTRRSIHCEDRAADLVKKHWKLKRVMKEVLKQKATYSNALAVLSFPFRKMLKCEKCDLKVPAEERLKDWASRDGTIVWETCCPNCKSRENPHVYDLPLQDPEKVSIAILDMEHVDTVKHPFSGKITCYYTIPEPTVTDIKDGEKEAILQTSQTILNAITESFRNQEGRRDPPRVRIKDNHCYLITDPTLSEVETGGLAFPAFAASFKEYWQYRTMLKAQQTILQGHATPKRFLYPEASSTSGNIFEMVHVASFMDLIKEEVAKHEQDPNYVSVSPFPVGELNMGGDAKMLSFSNEIRISIESMCAALQTPLEFLYGGMSYSASSITVKKMYVQFEASRESALELLQWAVDEIHKNMKCPKMHLELAPFRLADDLQHLQLMTGLQGANIISRKRLQEEAGVDPRSEDSQILEEQRFMTQLQKARVQAQAQAQEVLGSKPAVAQAKGMAASIHATLEEIEKLRAAISEDPEKMNILMTMPELYHQVFGVGSPTPPPAATDQQERVPNPQLLAPEAAQENVGGSLEPSVVRSILQMFNNAPIESWQELKNEIRVNFGPEVLADLEPKLAELQSSKSYAPEDRPGRAQSGFQSPI